MEAAAPLTSFVGRSGELAEVARVLGQHRLVTLTGAGGCGKTRLADRVVAEVAGSWPDGAGSVDLASVADPHLVPTAIARGVGLAIEPGGVDSGGVAEQLRHRRLLLWLDTCEHVRDVVAELVEVLLTRCAGVSILATSREPLGVASEVTWRVPALRTPEAVQLFEDRAALVGARSTGATDPATVEQVCASVDNLPLGIELAAPWVRALGLRQIADGLDDALRLLVGGPRSGAERHQTMTACIAWSHDLLDEPGQVLFRRLSVFAGPFTLEAAGAVAYTDDPPVRFDEVLREVTRLLDASLLSTTELQGELRYLMLDTVRQYAREKLVEAQELATTTARHLDFHRSLAESAEAAMDHDQERWRAVLTAHRSDIQRAIRLATAADDGAVEKAAHLAATMSRHWLITGDVAAGIRLLEDARRRRSHGDGSGTAPSGIDSAVRLTARLHAGRAMLAMAAGDLATVTAEAGAGITLAQPIDDQASLARCLALSSVSLFFTDFEACTQVAVRATELGVRGGDAFARDWASVIHAYALVTRCRNDEADQVAHGVVVRARGRRDRFCGGFALGVGIYTQLTRGRVATAVSVGHQALDLIRPLGDYFGSGTIAANTAHAVAVSGDLDGAAQLMEPVVHSMANPAADAVGFMVPLGLINLWRGDLDESIRWFLAGVARLEQRPADWTAARCIPGLVGALRRKGDLEQAAVWADRGIALLTAFAAPFELADLLDEQARLETEKPGRARELHLQSLVVRRDHRIRLGTATSLEGLARAEAAAGDLAQAVYLDAAAQQARSGMGHPRPRVDDGEREAFLADLPPAKEHPIVGKSRREGDAVDLDALVNTLTRGRGPRRMTSGELGALTATEVEVANLVSDGLTNIEIAAQLFMSRGTVKAHLSHVYTKLGVPNRAALAAFVRTHRG